MWYYIITARETTPNKKEVITMTRTVNVDMEIKAKKATTAINKFFNKYPHLDYWSELVENMFAEGTEHVDDTIMADGSYNNEWSYSIWTECSDENYYYIAIVERS